VTVHFRRFFVGDFFKLVIPFVGVICLGVAARLLYPCGWWPYDLMPPLADAFVVGGVVGLGLELFATKFLIERVGDDLSKKLVGPGLPPELQEHIADIVRTKRVRDHYVKSYRFSKPEAGRVRIDLEVTFDVHNYSHSTVLYKPEMDEEEVFKPEFLYLEYGIRGEASHTLGKEQLAVRVKSKHPPSTATRLVDGDKAVRLKPGAVCSVTWRWSVVMPEEFSDTTEFREATIGATMRVLDGMPDGLRFESAGDNMLPRDEGSLSWVFEGPFIAGQQVRTRWIRR
jgi:hypothetical protein